MLESTKSSATFGREATLTNYSGFKFDFTINRKISLLPTREVNDALGIESTDSVSMVAFKTENTLTNTGNDWNKDTGLLSIWLLCMFNPSPETTVVAPYISGEEKDLGNIVNDEYFGKVPSERLIVKENTMFFKADGILRSKIGLPPTRSKDILGSYDAENKVLTIVKYNKPKENVGYVNSLWELQDEPYNGDAINSYNDGPAEPGAEPMGPFYELETSSPALSLISGESGTHIQITSHFQGDEDALNQLSEKLLGVSLDAIQDAFDK